MTLFPHWMQRPVDAVLAPMARSLGTSGVSPNAITTVGTLVLVGSGVAFAAAQVRLGALLLLLSGVCDMLDGKVARSNGLVTQFGAFYDSTLDRIGEAALFLGIAWYFVSGGVTGGLAPLAMAMTFIAAGAGMIVSYARARAEGLGLDCKVGIAQHPGECLGGAERDHRHPTHCACVPDHSGGPPGSVAARHPGSHRSGGKGTPWHLSSGQPTDGSPGASRASVR
ncbi:MAG: CDP-alcohol phosphatidyltransferase family protein [Gemmatimonadetes bacterium]|nr:CDP-alcohol phosphatidyltransferase family protein [Gemmatimonadota bacterium]